MLFLLKDMHVANYADDTTLYMYGGNIESVIKSLNNQPIFCLIGLKTIR